MRWPSNVAPISCGWLGAANGCGSAKAALLYLRAKGIGGWGQTVRRYTGRGESSPVGPDLPGWLDRGLAERLDQGARLGRLGNSGGPSHPWHPQAVASFC